MKRGFKIIAALAISVIALGLAVYKVRWDDFITAFLNIRFEFMLVVFAGIGCNLCLRAIRWRLLLSPFIAVSWQGLAFRYYMIGYMMNILFPFKAGELLRPYLFSQKTKTSMTQVLTTVIAERIMDLIFLSTLLLLTVYIGVVQVPVKVTHSIFAIGVAAGLLWMLVCGNRFGAYLNRYLLACGAKSTWKAHSFPCSSSISCCGAVS